MASFDQLNVEEAALLEDVDVSLPARGKPLRAIGAVVFGTVAIAGLTARTTGLVGSSDGLIQMSGGCTNDGENCMTSRCCNNEHSKCYKKNDHWASCNSTCDSYQMWNHDKNIFEKQDHKVWECAELIPCTANGESCLDSRCCSEAGSTCYQKNEHWASCNATCDPYQLWNHDTEKFEKQDTKQWQCHGLSCSADGENCMHSQCCSRPGSTCYKKNEHWSSCNATCSPKMKWNHDTLAWEEQDAAVWDCSVVGESAGDDDVDTGAPAPTPPSSCLGCGGEQCTICYNAAIEECQDAECQGCSGEQCTSCRNDKYASCCADVDAPATFCDDNSTQ